VCSSDLDLGATKWSVLLREAAHTEFHKNRVTVTHNTGDAIRKRGRVAGRTGTCELINKNSITEFRPDYHKQK
jgi:hypothetical protein